MSNTTNIYTIGKTKQLIDLNGDSVNFMAEFTITSKDKQPFDMLVIDQNTLDNTQEIKYKNISEGIISGKITHDDNVYQNYFIVLRSEKPCTCEVKITKQEIPPKKVKENEEEKVVERPVSPPPIKSETNWLKIAMIGLVVIGGVLAVYYFYNKDKKKEGTNNRESFGFNRKPAKFEMSPSPSSHSPIPPPRGPNKLLSRLKNLNIS